MYGRLGQATTCIAGMSIGGFLGGAIPGSAKMKKMLSKLFMNYIMIYL